MTSQVEINSSGSLFLKSERCYGNKWEFDSYYQAGKAFINENKNDKANLVLQKLTNLYIKNSQFRNPDKEHYKNGYFKDAHFYFYQLDIKCFKTNEQGIEHQNTKITYLCKIAKIKLLMGTCTCVPKELIDAHCLANKMIEAHQNYSQTKAEPTITLDNILLIAKKYIQANRLIDSPQLAPSLTKSANDLLDQVFRQSEQMEPCLKLFKQIQCAKIFKKNKEIYRLQELAQKMIKEIPSLPQDESTFQLWLSLANLLLEVDFDRVKTCINQAQQVLANCDPSERIEYEQDLNTFPNLIEYFQNLNDTQTT